VGVPPYPHVGVRATREAGALAAKNAPAVAAAASGPLPVVNKGYGCCLAAGIRLERIDGPIQQRLADLLDDGVRRCDRNDVGLTVDLGEC
jgi:hypothetical protein